MLMWFMNEKLNCVWLQMGYGAHTLEGYEVFRPIWWFFHMHCLKSFIKVCPQSQSRHPQAVHMFYGKQHLSAKETF